MKSEKSTPRKAGIIGAGIGGLAAAAVLARHGVETHVFDPQPGPGGKAFTKTENGFRFDTGPSLLTLLGYFDEHFQACGRRREDYLAVTPLGDLCHYFMKSGERLVSQASVPGMIQTLVQAGWASKESAAQFFRHAQGIHRWAADLFLKHSLQDPKSLFTWKTLNSILHFPKIDAFRTMTQALKSFFPDPRALQLFQRYATYNGSSPFQVPGTLNMIPFVEYSGAWSVDQGIYAIPLALEALAQDLGVQFHYGQRVEKILTQGRRVTGLATSQGSFNFDLVVSNADVLPTYDLLQDPQAPLARRYRRLEKSSSGVVFYWGLNRSFPDLGLHNIFFSGDYEKEFRQIFQEKILPEDPTVYVNITSKTTSGDAPPGMENWFVLINAPPHEGQDWAPLVRQLRDRVLARVEQALGQKVADHLVSESWMTPEDIQNQTGSPGGSLYGISSNTPLAAFLRHPNKSRRWKGLYFCSGGAHPGGGMPLALQSGRIAADLALRDQRIKP